MILALIVPAVIIGLGVLIWWIWSGGTYIYEGDEYQGSTFGCTETFQSKKDDKAWASMYNHLPYDVKELIAYKPWVNGWGIALYQRIECLRPYLDDYYDRTMGVGNYTVVVDYDWNRIYAFRPNNPVLCKEEKDVSCKCEDTKKEELKPEVGDTLKLYRTSRSSYGNSSVSYYTFVSYLDVDDEVYWLLKMQDGDRLAVVHANGNVYPNDDTSNWSITQKYSAKLATVKVRKTHR